MIGREIGYITDTKFKRAVSLFLKAVLESDKAIAGEYLEQLRLSVIKVGSSDMRKFIFPNQNVLYIRVKRVTLSGMKLELWYGNKEDAPYMSQELQRALKQFQSEIL